MIQCAVEIVAMVPMHVLPGKLGKGNQPSTGLGPVQLLLEEARLELSKDFCTAARPAGLKSRSGSS